MDMSTELFAETEITGERADFAPLTVRDEVLRSHTPLADTRRVWETKPTRQPVRTALVDNDAFFRNGVLRVLRNTSCEIIASCAGVAELSTAAVHNTQLVIFAADEYWQSIQYTIRSLRQANHGLQIIVLGKRVETEKLTDLLREGISCYLVKDGLTPVILTKAIELILLGTVLFTGHCHDEMVKVGPSTGANGLSIGAEPAGADQNKVLPEVESNEKRLSNRERAILSFLMKGAANKDIALHLSITEATVKIHVKNLLIKIGAKNRTQAALWAWKSRIEES
jgi:two-component system, NarL family, nitrate/nitrite response regulator NarL